jgi:hypothetical protein
MLPAATMQQTCLWLTQQLLMTQLLLSLQVPGDGRELVVMLQDATLLHVRLWLTQHLLLLKLLLPLLLLLL